MDWNVCDVMTAKDWVREYLEQYSIEEPAEASMVMAAGKAAGFSRKELRAAKKELRVISTNNWSKETRVATEWYWALPEGSQS